MESIIPQPLILQLFQQKAVNDIAKRQTSTDQRRGASMLVQGGVGAGKTAVVSTATLRAIQKSTNVLKGPVRVLVAVPSIGGNLPLHWLSELARLGVADVLLYADKNFAAKEAAWAAKMSIVGPDEWRRRPLFIVLTFHKLHADVTYHGRESYLLSVTFDRILMDEAQFYRNLSNRLRELQDYDPEKRMAASLMRVIEASPLAVITTISATPFYNSKVDVYSLCVAMRITHGTKAAWMRNANKEEWRKQKEWFMDQHCHCIAVAPEVAREDDLIVTDPTFTTLGPRETELVRKTYGEAKPAIEKLFRLFNELHHLGGAAREAKQREIDQAFHHFQTIFVRCRRGLLHPAFYDEAIKVVNVKGKEVTQPVDMKRLGDFTDADCSKFTATLGLLKTMSGRVLITSQFSRPLDFLAEFLGQRSSWAVLVHHGGKDCVKALQKFKELGHTGNVVMLATAGSCGEGINLSFTTDDGASAVQLICLDYPFSHASQTQLQGRIKRPLAQPDVVKWYVHRIMSTAKVQRLDGIAVHVSVATTATVAEAASAAPTAAAAAAPAAPAAANVMNLSTVDMAMRDVLKLKKGGADEVFMSEEELASCDSQGSVGAAVAAGGDKSFKPLLQAVFDLCKQWEATETPAQEATRLKETRDKAIERKRKREGADAALDAALDATLSSKAATLVDFV